MLTRKQLRPYLAYVVLGIKSTPKRKPPIRAKRATPRKGPPRSEAYKAWIRTLPSLVSGLKPCEACHTGQDGGMSMKASDYSCVPLTSTEHREYHRIGRRAFEKRYRVNFACACKRLNATWRERIAA